MNYNLNELKIKEFMQALPNERITGEAGTGFVKVIIDGRGKIVKIDYEKNDYITNDLDMFVDLIRIAFNNAQEKMLKDQISRIEDVIKG